MVAVAAVITAVVFGLAFEWLRCHRWGCRGRVAGNLCLDEGCGHDKVTRNVDATRGADTISSPGLAQSIKSHNKMTS